MERGGSDEMPFWAARGKRGDQQANQEDDDEIQLDQHEFDDQRDKRAAPQFLMNPGADSSAAMFGNLIRNRPVRPAGTGPDAFWAARGKKSGGLEK